MKNTLIILMFLAFPAFALTPEEEAKICDEYASPLDPHLPAGTQYRMYHRPEHFERDLQACLATLERQPDNPRIAYQIGEVYSRRAAYEAMMKVVAIETDYRHGASGSIVALEENARRYWLRAGDYPVARYALANGLNLSEEEKKQQLEALLPDLPALAHYGLGRWYDREKGQEAQAREHYRQAVAAGNNHALLELARHEKGNPGYAGLLHEAIEKSHRPQAFSQLITYLQEQGQADEAAIWLEKLRERARHHPDYAVSLAMLEARKYEKDGKFDADALPWLQQAAEAGMNAAVLFYETTLDRLEQGK